MDYTTIELRQIASVSTDKNINKQYEKEINFIDGPPFVSSDTLHYGHILVSDIKDTMRRYFQMNQTTFEDTPGFDCHGLPIELKVNEALDLKTSDDIREFGLDNYVRECKKTIMKFSDSWKPIYEKIGRQTNFSKGYRTMDKNYIESVWWVFNELTKKDLVYRGYRIMPYSIACQTPLSNFEASQSYKIKEDRSAYVKFPFVFEKNKSFIAWTTTPWTLTSNLALSINSKIEYCEIKPNDSDEIWIIAKECLKNLFGKKLKGFQIIDTKMGEHYLHTQYIPPFYYFEDFRKQGCFCVLDADFVNTESGTGIVHTAPAFGQDDFETCVNVHSIIDTRDIGLVCPVDSMGRFEEHIDRYKNIIVHDANDLIIQDLKEKNIIVKQETIEHSYPYCWRTDTPLIYKAVSSFFINVRSIKDQLIEANKKVNWVPESVGSNRFGNWLRDARDWGVSRNRFFGTPVPVWCSDDYEETITIGSISELEELTKMKFEDIHLDNVQDIKIISKSGNVLSHCGEVLDCWFESGSAPYAKLHYPFENANYFDNREFITDFICEGIDQTRGWFYTMMVLSVALFNKPAYKNVICSGLILAEDGLKMSKRLKNYPEPNIMIDQYGSDTLRLYLISSPATHGESLKFNEKNLSLNSKKLNQLIHCVSFLNEYRTHYELTTSTKFVIDENINSDNFMDKYIINRTYLLIDQVRTLMNDFKITKACNETLNFIEELANLYIKLNRDRMKGKLDKDEQYTSLNVLYTTIVRFSIIFYPFAPFTSAYIYKQLTNKELCEQTYFDTQNICLDPEILRSMDIIKTSFTTIRSVRADCKTLQTFTKFPLKKTSLYLKEDIQDVYKESIIKYISEINNIETVYIDLQETLDLFEYDVIINHRNIGTEFRQDAKKIKKYLETIKQDELKHFIDTNTLEIIDGINKFILNNTHIQTTKKLKSTDIDNTIIKLDQLNNIMIFDLTIEQHLIETFYTNMINFYIQQLRKKHKLHTYDIINVSYHTTNTFVKDTITKNNEQLYNLCGSHLVPFEDSQIILNQETIMIEDNEITIYLF